MCGIVILPPLVVSVLSSPFLPFTHTYPMPSSSRATRTPTTPTDPLVEAERACAQFEATHASTTSTQTAAAMEAYRGLSARVTQAVDQWSTQHATYKALLDAEPQALSQQDGGGAGFQSTDTRSVAELLTTVNELATKLDQEVEAMGHGTGSMDAALSLWQQHETAYAVLQARLGASSRKAA